MPTLTEFDAIMLLLEERLPWQVTSWFITMPCGEYRFIFWVLSRMILASGIVPDAVVRFLKSMYGVDVEAVPISPIAPPWSPLNKDFNPLPKYT